MKRKEAGKVYRLSSSLKRLGRSIARKNRRSISLQVMKDAAMRKRVLVILQKDLQRELESMCSLHHNSVLRSTSPIALKKFSWMELEEEIRRTAPTLHALLDGTLHVHIPPSAQRRRARSKTRRVNKSAVLGFCAAILCRYRNQSMNLVQRLLSVLLYKSGASKQVCNC